MACSHIAESIHGDIGKPTAGGRGDLRSCGTVEPQQIRFGRHTLPWVHWEDKVHREGAKLNSRQNMMAVVDILQIGCQY